MSPSKRAGSRSLGASKPSEQTPLLSSTPDAQQIASAADAGQVQAVQVAAGNQNDALKPSHLLRSRTDPSAWSARSDDAERRDDSSDLQKWQDNGKLVGIGDWRFRFMFGGILLGYFIAMFDSTLMASSHPVITSYFNASNSASWLSTAFIITSTSLQPLMGRLSDTFGRRLLYLAGLAFLACMTAWCALAQSIGSFIVARALCGVGAAGVVTAGNIMTNDLVAIRVRGTYQAYINLFYGGGSACGAAFGGFLCDRLGWRMNFALQVPILILLLINAVFTTPAMLGPELAKTQGLGFRDAMKGFDISGSLLLTVSVAFLILALNLGGNVLPWNHPLVIVSLVVAVLAGAIFIHVESRAARPVMPLPMLFSRPRGTLVFGNFFSQVGLNTVLFNAPLYFQAVKLESVSTSGFRLAGPSIALTVCGVSAGFIITRTGDMKWLIRAGALAMLLGATLLSSMRNDIPASIATIMLVPSSIGQGLAFPATLLAVLAVSSQEDQAVMTSTLTLWRNLGTVMGVSFSSLVLQNTLKLYLERLVTGNRKSEIIQQVRKSVRSIIDLDAIHQSQVIRAYHQSLRLVFILAAVMFVIVNVLVIAIRLPSLKQKEAPRAHEEGEADQP